MTYHKPVYLKSFPSANNCQIYFSIYYPFLKWFIKQTELFSSTPFRVISLSFLKPVLAHGTRWIPLCCFTQNWAVITGAESHSCPLAGSHWSAQSPVNDMHWWSQWLRFYNHILQLFVIGFKPTAFNEKEYPHLFRHTQIQLGCLVFEHEVL